MQLNRSWLKLGLLFVTTFTFYAHATICDGLLSELPTVPSKIEYLKTQFIRGASSLASADRLAQTIQTQSAAEQSEWLQAIVMSYQVIAKGQAGPPMGIRVGGKRILDRLLFHLQKTHEKFEMVSGQIGAKSAFEKMLKEQTDAFQTPCNSIEILRVVENLRNELGEWSKTHSGRMPTILIAGSFINGKWRPGSDIDIHISDYSIWRQISDRLQESVVRGASPDCRPVLSPHIEDENFFGKLNPFALEIGPNSNRLMVFEPALFLQGHQPPTGAMRSYDWPL